MKIVCNNKKAGFEYFLLEKYVAGIVLEGSEVKSIRQGGVSLDQSFIFITDSEIFLKNCYVKPYEKASSFAPNERRDRKLLLNKKDIIKLENKVKTKGFTIVPTKVLFNDKNLVKIEIALAQGKHSYDKKETIKQRDIERDVKRNLANL